MAAALSEVCERIRRVRCHVVRISQEEAARRPAMSLEGYGADETFREPSLARLRQLALVRLLPQSESDAADGRAAGPKQLSPTPRPGNTHERARRTS